MGWSDIHSINIYCPDTYVLVTVLNEGNTKVTKALSPTEEHII